jgi:hypothetical protein
MQKLDQALACQLNLNQTKNLLHSEAERLLEIDPTFVAAIEELLGSPADEGDKFEVDEIAAAAADSLIDRILTINQYIQLDGEARKALVDIYVGSWRKMVETTDIEQTLRTYHYPQLQSFLEDLYPETLREALRSATDVGQVPSSEYSAELQMRVLRLDESRMKEPILDVGCGRDACLVRQLRAWNLEAYGIDRRVERPADFVTNADWFDYDLGHRRWGTIIAHLAFTNHIVYCQRYDPANMPRYAGRYREMLDALAPGGSFVYAPGVPVLEDSIEREYYRVHGWAVSAGVTATKVTRRRGQARP